MTETGGSLTRFFDDKELSNLLALGKRGKCEILDRFPRRVIHSSNLPFLDNHTKVHGIMRHDAIYQNFSNAYAGETGRRIAAINSKKKRSVSDTEGCDVEDSQGENKSLRQGSESPRAVSDEVHLPDEPTNSAV